MRVVVFRYVVVRSLWLGLFFFFQAEDGIRDLVRSRGLGDVYKRQGVFFLMIVQYAAITTAGLVFYVAVERVFMLPDWHLSLIHI